METPLTAVLTEITPRMSSTQATQQERDVNLTDVLRGPLQCQRIERLRMGREWMQDNGLAMERLVSVTHARKARRIRLRFRVYADAQDFRAYANSRAAMTGSTHRALIETNSARFSVASWNCNGGLAASIHTPMYRDLVLSNDVTFFQETHMAPGQEDILDLPRGFHPVARSRPWRHPLGGVTVIIRDTVKYRICDEIMHPDILVLELPSLILICSYLVPENSRWESWTHVDPKTWLGEAIEYLCLAIQGIHDYRRPERAYRPATSSGIALSTSVSR
uniref:Uncharacterized protein n=2 Tax=Psilocybe cubensis TaxID=181762 RepID=A0A8H7XQ28_PSICU